MSAPVKYTISPSMSAVAYVFGENANNYNIYGTNTKTQPKSIASVLSADFSGCYLKVSVSDPVTLAQIYKNIGSTLHIPIDAKQMFWLAFNKATKLTHETDSDTTKTSDLNIHTLELKIPISILGQYIITLIENINDPAKLTEYIQSRSNYNSRDAPQHDASNSNFSKTENVILEINTNSVPECYKPQCIRIDKIPYKNDITTTPELKPHTLTSDCLQLPEVCYSAIKYELVINLQKQNLKYNMDMIGEIPTHNFYPAMNERFKRHARLLDCKCFKFGCDFVCTTPEDLKHHLKTSACSDYVDFYAKNHKKLATDSLQIINDQLFKNSFPALCRKSISILQGIKGEEKHNTYVCNSPLCEYSTHTIENMLEHFRLLGCQYSPIIMKYYGVEHPMPTEADNRKWLVNNLVDNLNGNLSAHGHTAINSDIKLDIYQFNITPHDAEWHAKLVVNLALGAKCINCKTHRQNIVNISCCHLSVCSKCFSSFTSPKCADCFTPIDEYLVISGI